VLRKPLTYRSLTNFFLDEDELNSILLGMYNIEYFTCIRFVKRTNETDFVNITVSFVLINSNRIHKRFFNRAIVTAAIRMLDAFMAPNN
jgi:hypothetical protein